MMKILSSTTKCAVGLVSRLKGGAQLLTMWPLITSYALLQAPQRYTSPSKEVYQIAQSCVQGLLWP